MRREDIQELIKDIKDNIEIIDNQYEKAIDDDSIKSVLKPKVKSSLESLRSCLEYCAHDIYDKYYNEEIEKIYFPYGKKAQNFRSSAGKYFRNLKNINPEVYNLLESIQPYKCGSDWLIELCELTNHNKHNSLSRQERIDRGAVSILGLAYIENSKNVHISNNYINGVHQGSDIIIDNNGKAIYDKETVNLQVEQINWVEFKFEDTNIGVKEILKESLSEIEKFVESLYKKITKES